MYCAHLQSVQTLQLSLSQDVLEEKRSVLTMVVLVYTEQEIRNYLAVGDCVQFWNVQ